jgi:hypothetical protein
MSILVEDSEAKLSYCMLHMPYSLSPAYAVLSGIRSHQDLIIMDN